MWPPFKNLLTVSTISNSIRYADNILLMADSNRQTIVTECEGKNGQRLAAVSRGRGTLAVIECLVSVLYVSPKR